MFRKNEGACEHYSPFTIISCLPRTETRKQEQENHGDHLITAEPRALPLNEDERGDQPIAADLADMLQVLST